MDKRFFLIGRHNENAWCPQFPVSMSTQLWSFGDHILARHLSNVEFSAGEGAGNFIGQFLSSWILRFRLMVGFKINTILTYLNFSFCSILCVLFSKKNICWLRCWFLREGYFLIFLLPSAYVNNWLSLLPPAPKSHYQVHQIKTLNIDYKL